MYLITECSKVKFQALMHRCTQISIVRITDPDEYAALEQQIREFGQIPDQLFMEPHPSKTVQVHTYAFVFQNYCISTLHMYATVSHQSFIRSSSFGIFTVACEISCTIK